MRSPERAFDLRAAISAEIRAALAALEDVPHNPAATHACRVRLKRARALARVGRVAAPGFSDMFDASARVVMQALAPARELSALAETARTSAAKLEKRKASQALDAAATKIEALRAAHGASVETLRAALADMLALAQVWPEASARQIRRGAAHVARRAKRARRRWCGAKDQHLRHKWRKREKDRAYAAEILGRAWPGPRKLKTARKLCEALGRERDLLLLIERLSVRPLLANDEPSPASAVNALARVAKRHRREADSLGRKLRGV